MQLRVSVVKLLLAVCRRPSPGYRAADPHGTSSVCIFRKCIFEKCIFRKFCKFLAGSFSAVSKRNFARKYAFDSIFQALQDLQPFAPLQSQNFSKKSVLKNSIFHEISAQKLQMSKKLQNLWFLQNCCWIFTKIADFSNRFLLEFWDCSGSKACKSCRAWKMLPNAYF